MILVVDNAKDGGGEGHDRYNISLSAPQIALANAVIAANPSTVLVPQPLSWISQSVVPCFTRRFTGPRQWWHHFHRRSEGLSASDS